MVWKLEEEKLQFQKTIDNFELLRNNFELLKDYLFDKIDDLELEVSKTSILYYSRQHNSVGEAEKYIVLREIFFIQAHFYCLKWVLDMFGNWWAEKN